MADEVRERLFGLDFDAGHFGPQVGQNGFQKLVAADAGMRVHRQNVFADVDRLGMFVQLGPAGAAGKVEDGPVGIRGRSSASLRACGR